MKQFGCCQYLGALLRICDVQLIQVGFLQSTKVLQTLETMHGEKRFKVLDRKENQATCY